MFRRMFGRILRRFASEEDRKLLNEKSGMRIRFGVMARVARRYVWVYVAVLVTAGIVTVASGMDIYHRTEGAQFCGSCHEMQHNFATWQASHHKDIRCVDCHANPGLSGWLSAKLGGVRQLGKHITAAKIDDIHMKDIHRQVVNNNCSRCHKDAVKNKDIRGIRIAHAKHRKLTKNCISCHTRAFAHPDPKGKMAANKSKAAAKTIAKKIAKSGASTGAVMDYEPPVSTRVETRACHNCHDGKSKLGKTVAFAAVDAKNCQKCHMDTKMANSHGGDEHTCKSCHSVSKGNKHFAFSKKEAVKICAKCHEFKETLASAHKPFKTGQCLSCHRVMRPQQLHLTSAKPSAQTCLSCHKKLQAKLKKGAKELTGFADDDSDLHREHLEQLGKDQAWCLKCHNAHGSQKAKFLLSFKLTDEEKKEGGDAVFTAAAKGGSCKGGCHGEDSAEYTRK